MLDKSNDISATDLIGTLYSTLLNRGIDQQGLDSKLARFNSGGIDLEGLVSEIFNSEEFTQRLPILARERGLQAEGDTQGRDRTPFHEPVGARGAVEAPSTELDDLIYGLYSALLGRLPGEQGVKEVARALGSGELTMTDVVGGIVESDEFQDGLPAMMRRYGTGGVALNRDVVASLYKVLLDREPDQVGLEAKLSGLSQGTLSLNDVVGELLGSEEFYDKLPDLLKRFAGREERYITNYGAVVEAVYLALLDREPDKEGFYQKVQGLGRRDFVIEDVVREIIGSDEFFAKLPTLLNRNRADATRFVIDVAHLVIVLYSVLLDRRPEPIGLQSKIDRLAAAALSLDDLIREIVESAEYLDRQKADLLRRGLVVNDRFTNDVSQYGETWLVIRDMINSASWARYVVDVGARGRERSNSYDLLRHFGWRGVLIEANPRLIESIRADFEGLDCEITCCAISDYDGTAIFNIGANDDVSSLIKAAAAGWGEVRDEIEVRVRMLPEVLREHDAPLSFDLLSIDIEGEDVRALNHLIDASAYRPTWVIIEVAEEDADSSLAAIGLSQKVCDTYEIMGRTPSNLLLRRKEADFGPERLVRALYLGLLDRPADESGLSAKSVSLAQGKSSFEDLVGELVGSEEFFDRLPALIRRYGGDLERGIIRSVEVVSDLYEVLLGRPVDALGLQAKLDGLANSTRTVADIARELINSEEFASAPPLQARASGSEVTLPE
ncbi:FkbM family methyltransferase [Caulobacter sp. S45]|uniref:FkbM family methyltransferase n=1 Tax=Caulobacter sp. S45 TaxID=1641861 RepID=UPI001577595D|nr:FkbM family methyltransferase [Caulobacter sp. S45]